MNTTAELEDLLGTTTTTWTGVTHPTRPWATTWFRNPADAAEYQHRLAVLWKRDVALVERDSIPPVTV